MSFRAIGAFGLPTIALCDGGGEFDQVYMPYFLADKNLYTDGTFEISGEEAAHILLSHRSKKGDTIKIQGPDQKRFLAEVVQANKKSLLIKVLREIAVPHEPLVRMVLFQALVSEKALDFILQKTVELGVAEIVLFNSKNTALKITEAVYEKKQLRWGKILVEAAKQSERAVCPKLNFCTDLPQVLASAKKLDVVYLADLSGQKMHSPQPVSSAGLIVGPEGGFEAQEVEQIQKLPQCVSVSLGNFILRAETASVALAALVANSPAK